LTTPLTHLSIQDKEFLFKFFIKNVFLAPCGDNDLFFAATDQLLMQQTINNWMLDEFVMASTTSSLESEYLKLYIGNRDGFLDRILIKGGVKDIKLIKQYGGEDLDVIFEITNIKPKNHKVTSDQLSKALKSGIQSDSLSKFDHQIIITQMLIGIKDRFPSPSPSPPQQLYEDLMNTLDDVSAADMNSYRKFTDIIGLFNDLRMLIYYSQTDHEKNIQLVSAPSFLFFKLSLFEFFFHSLNRRPIKSYHSSFLIIIVELSLLIS